MVFGLAPAIHAAKGNLVAALREGGRTGDGGVRNRARNILVVAEVALSIVLLVGAALFMRSFLNLQRADTGFDPAPITTVRIFMPGEAYQGEGAMARRVDDVMRRLEAMPGVLAAGASNLIPLDGGGDVSRVDVEGAAGRARPRAAALLRRGHRALPRTRSARRWCGAAPSPPPRRRRGRAWPWSTSAWPAAASPRRRQRRAAAGAQPPGRRRRARRHRRRGPALPAARRAGRPAGSP